MFINIKDCLWPSTLPNTVTKAEEHMPTCTIKALIAPSALAEMFCLSLPGGAPCEQQGGQVRLTCNTGASSAGDSFNDSLWASDIWICQSWLSDGPGVHGPAMVYQCDTSTRYTRAPQTYISQFGVRGCVYIYSGLCHGRGNRSQNKCCCW